MVRSQERADKDVPLLNASTLPVIYYACLQAVFWSSLGHALLFQANLEASLLRTSSELFIPLANTVPVRIIYSAFRTEH